jgi:hypothetical protein
MLYEFHRQQNGKKPGTVHATYLLSGTKREEERESTPTPIKKDGEDDYMQSSPFMNSSMPQPDDTGASSVLTITLTREEDLDSSFLPHCCSDITDKSRGPLTIHPNILHTYLQFRAQPS